MGIIAWFAHASWAAAAGQWPTPGGRWGGSGWGQGWGQGWGNGNTGGSGNGVQTVPEIDVSAGMLAVAAVAAGLLLAWELRRRRRGVQG
ncbi:VPEID-CTERM sorting domain-containing protein [Phaeobacter sp.]|uniref:VPEID-CTERM sorting domain-containing protein n=1 Tax=Phaeobacter sp. TaxID=1902409 RepID=UPI0025FDF9A2|nr:VPEID-CTERM sorting domain-containing protein [Phaeobacter sp.]